MPEKLIDFTPRLESGEAALAGGQAAAYNVLVTTRGAVRRRPAIVAYSEAPVTAIDGANAINGLTSYGATIYATTTGQRVFAVQGGSAANLSITGYESELPGRNRPTFAHYRTPIIAIATGDVLQKINPLTNVSTRLAGTPPICSQVVSMSQRLIANEGTSVATQGAFRYSDAGYPEVWDALRRADTEADPDKIVALRTNMNELFAFCERSLQIFTPDPNTIFSPQRSRRLGCAAPHSVVENDETFYWFDPKRRFVASDGRSFEDISPGIAAVLDGISTVDDCFGYRVAIDQFDLMAWTFPTDSRTFVFQPAGGWSQWSQWVDGIGHQRFPVNAHHYWEDRNVHIVGLTDGRICKLDVTASQDIGGTEIKAQVETAYITHDTSATKTCERVTLEIVRGFASSGSVSLSYRDDGGSWSIPIVRSLGGDHLQFIHCYSLGTYRQRQWRIEMTDSADFTLARAVEKFSVGSN